MKTNEELFKAFIVEGFSECEDIIIKDDMVWGRMTGRGTHKGQFGPLSPTGKGFEITVIDIMRLKTENLSSIGVFLIV